LDLAGKGLNAFSFLFNTNPYHISLYLKTW
jgi:hypothetical protein